MTKKTKWITGAVVAVLVSGALFALPALAEDAAPFGMMGMHRQMMGNTDMAKMHAQMMGAGGMGRMHGRMMGNTDMAKMHEAMAPLMEQMPAMHEQMMTEVAELLGMTYDELQTALSEGKTLATLAEEKQVAPEEIKTLMTENMKSFLDSAVAAGTITQEQADTMLEHHEEMSGGCMTGQGPGMGMMHGHMGAPKSN